MNRDILEGAASRVDPATQNISNGVVLPSFLATYVAILCLPSQQVSQQRGWWLFMCCLLHTICPSLLQRLLDEKCRDFDTIACCRVNIAIIDHAVVHYTMVARSFAYESLLKQQEQELSMADRSLRHFFEERIAQSQLSHAPHASLTVPQPPSRPNGQDDGSSVLPPKS